MLLKSKSIKEDGVTRAKSRKRKPPKTTRRDVKDCFPLFAWPLEQHCCDALKASCLHQDCVQKVSVIDSLNVPTKQSSLPHRMRPDVVAPDWTLAGVSSVQRHHWKQKSRYFPGTRQNSARMTVAVIRGSCINPPPSPGLSLIWHHNGLLDTKPRLQT